MFPSFPRLPFPLISFFLFSSCYVILLSFSSFLSCHSLLSVFPTLFFSSYPSYSFLVLLLFPSFIHYSLLFQLFSHFSSLSNFRPCFRFLMFPLSPPFLHFFSFFLFTFYSGLSFTLPHIISLSLTFFPASLYLLLPPPLPPLLYHFLFVPCIPISFLLYLCSYHSLLPSFLHLFILVPSLHHLLLFVSSIILYFLFSPRIPLSPLLFIAPNLSLSLLPLCFLLLHLLSFSVLVFLSCVSCLSFVISSLRLTVLYG